MLPVAAWSEHAPAHSSSPRPHGVFTPVTWRAAHLVPGVPGKELLPNRALHRALVSRT